jgi:SAM-dependent methyltransferase
LLQQRLKNFNLQGQVDCGDITAMPYPAQSFDRIFGSMILHHIKDFDSLGRELARVLKPTGKAVFWENSGENPLLRFARNHLAGRSWLGFKIPKFGDYEEEPLRRSSIEVLAQKIGSYELHFNQCVFFRVFDIYISRGRIPGVKQLCSSLDRVAARTPFRKYGYLQIVEFIKR